MMSASWPLRTCLAACVLSVALSAGVFDVRSYGGKGDGTTMNTAAFAAAISDAHAFYATNALPGVVLTEDGVYLSGQIQLLRCATHA